MSNKIKTYILAPTANAPPGGPIGLGNIIVSPRYPEEKENSNAPAERTGDNQTYNARKRGWSEEDNKHHNVEVGFFTSFLQILGIGGDAGVKHSEKTILGLSAEYMDTCWFNPTKQYVKDSVQDPGVKAYIGNNKWGASLYMITGLMVARGASASKKEMAERGFHAQVGSDLTAMGVPVTVGPMAELSQGKEQAIKFDHASDFVFAYRLREIRVKRDGTTTSRNHNKGATYDNDIEDGKPSDSGSELTYQISDEDVSAESLGASSSKLSDAEGSMWECVVLK